MYENPFFFFVKALYLALLEISFIGIHRVHTFQISFIFHS